MKPGFVFFALLAGLMPGSLCPANDVAPVDPHPIAWEGQFSQCSYNALSAVLDYFYGRHQPITNAKAFEDSEFVVACNASGYGPYFGWGPWTGYIATSGKLSWNHTPVADLKTARFSLRTKADVDVRPRIMLVHYATGEREALRAKLVKELKIGPVVMWSPYAALIDSSTGRLWHHVTELDGSTDSVRWGNVTHSVALFLKGNDEVEVMDCSVRDGLYTTDLDTLVATSCAMTAMVRLKDADGKSMLDRGFNGIKDDEYNVVFFKDAAPQAAATQPAATEPAADSISIPDVLANRLPANLRLRITAQLRDAGDNAPQLADALEKSLPDQLDAMAFLLAYMPRRDLESLPAEFLLTDVRLAAQARLHAAWASEIPEDIYLNDVLPYASLSETRDNWRPLLAALVGPQVANCKTPSQAALLLNQSLFQQLNVSYSATKRPKPDQSPLESISAGYASCTGLSILLVDACRAAGVPARAVGTPSWVSGQGDAAGNNAGNHTWVEVWDGRWHAIGAAEPGPLDQTWFMDDAARQFAARDNPLHRIYASRFSPGDASCFVMAWSPDDRTVFADEVTGSYSRASK